MLVSFPAVPFITCPGQLGHLAILHAGVTLLMRDQRGGERDHWHMESSCTGLSRGLRKLLRLSGLTHVLPFYLALQFRKTKRMLIHMRSVCMALGDES